MGKKHPSSFIPEAGVTYFKSYIVSGIKYITTLATTPTEECSSYPRLWCFFQKDTELCSEWDPKNTAFFKGVISGVS